MNFLYLLGEVLNSYIWDTQRSEYHSGEHKTREVLHTGVMQRLRENSTAASPLILTWISSEVSFYINLEVLLERFTTHSVLLSSKTYKSKEKSMSIKLYREKKH